MANKRVASLIAIAISLLIVFVATIYFNKRNSVNKINAYSVPLVSSLNDKNPLASLNDDFTLKNDFTTHLPIVIIDTKGIEPPITSIFDKEKQIYVPIKEKEPFVDGKIKIIDNGKNNQLKDTPITESDIRIKRRGNTSMMYAKPQYLVKLVTQTGQDNDVSLLNLGIDNEWILNGTMTDKSMMRNYLSYKTASQFLKYTPNTRYCEVVIKDGEKYNYQGVYLLEESIKQGVDRVNISEYKPTQYFNSYMVRRDRYDEEGIMLDTYATKNNLSGGYLGLRYPSKYSVKPQTIEYIENDISKIEKVLYSKNFSEFSTYPEYIDVDSFIDYYLLNEFFGNYDAGNNSTYMYKDLGGKLCIGPVWDFDGAFDNYTEKPMDYSALAFHTAPWFDMLIKDKTFIEKLEKRYYKLRKSYLSEENIINMVDEVCRFIEPARQREWTRWNDIRKEQSIYNLKPYRDNQDDKIYREVLEYDQEIYKLKTVIRQHGDAIPIQLKQLKGSAIWQTGFKNRNDLFLLVVLAIFFIPIIKITRN